MPSKNSIEARNALVESNMDLVDIALRGILKSAEDRFVPVQDDMRGAGYLALMEAAEMPEVVASDLPPFNRPYALVVIRRAMLREAQELLGLDRKYTERYQYVSLDEVRDLVDNETEDRILRRVDMLNALAEIKGERRS